SCSDFLDEDATSFLSSEAIYASNDGTESALTGAYSGLGNYNYFPSGFLNLVSAASSAMFTNHADSRDLLLSPLPTNKYLNDSYTDIYDAINRANDVIFNVQQGGARQDVKNKVEGEARFLRALSYFNLVRLIGGVPLRNAPTTSSTLHLPRASKEDVLALIISDLEKAGELMPEQNIKGRPNRYAAYALLAKVYLTMADGVPGSEYWSKALAEAKKVEGKYSLVPLSELYNARNTNTRESIFEVQLSVAAGRGWYWTRLIAPPNSNHTPTATSNPYARLRPTKYIFDTFRSQYPGDPRIDETFIYNSYRQRTGTTVIQTYPNIDPTLTGTNKARERFPYTRKFIDPQFTASGTNSNFIYLRYADVLLMLAEAENEVNGPAGAYVYVNQIMKRARESVTPNSAVPADWSDMTQEEFRRRIMQERMFELWGEQHEYFDLRRRGTSYFLDYIRRHNAHPNNDYNTPSADYNDIVYPETEEYAKRAMLLPFPSGEINSNENISDEDQNYGY
ncbi:MAG: starch-binding outer membrane protein SusD/RagB family, partial [Bacteroidota bacterium]|nr:starch-binding outer membrane protein SusD/RagB family [Bacteroidota bacterium]